MAGMERGVEVKQLTTQPDGRVCSGDEDDLEVHAYVRACM